MLYMIRCFINTYLLLSLLWNPQRFVYYELFTVTIALRTKWLMQCITEYIKRINIVDLKVVL